MTDIDELVKSIALRPPKIGKYDAILRLILGLAVGAAGAMLFMLAKEALAGPTGGGNLSGAPVTKIAYSTALAAAATVLAAQFSAPDCKATRKHLLAFAPVLVMAMIAMTELALSPPESWRGLIFGFGVSSCIGTILMATPPIFAGLIWSFQRFAPSDAKTAGAAIGALSGAAAGALYAAVSGDASACFVFIWYSFTVLITTLTGAFLGRFFLRW